MCPKCGAATEPIDIGVEGLPLEQWQLCPACYVVTWSDHDGLHVRQGVPVPKGVAPGGEPTPGEPTPLMHEPQEC